MLLRGRFDQSLEELRDSILMMGSRVSEELALALDAFKHLDVHKAEQVQEADKIVNQNRFAIEDRCFTLICTQQPAAGDLRKIVTAINMIVDIERMGDQAKGIAKVIPHLAERRDHPRPPELMEMGHLVSNMLSQTLQAYAESNVDMARAIGSQDEEVDLLYGRAFSQVMAFLAEEADQPERAQAAYEVVRVARELERFGDLAANVAERVVYMITGIMDGSVP